MQRASSTHSPMNEHPSYYAGNDYNFSTTNIAFE